MLAMMTSSSHSAKAGKQDCFSYFLVPTTLECQSDAFSGPMNVEWLNEIQKTQKPTGLGWIMLAAHGSGSSGYHSSFQILRQNILILAEVI